MIFVENLKVSKKLTKGQKKPIPITAEQKTLANVQFENKLAEVAGQQPAADPGQSVPGSAEPEKKDGRGGPREGAGRPLGATDDLSRANRLPEKANKLFVPILKMPFDLWGLSQNLKELGLTDKEADELALLVTQVLEWYFPGQVPVGAILLLSLMGTAYNIMKSRLVMIAELKKNKSTVPKATSASSSSGVTNALPSPRTDYPQVGT
jgi:hypothetical protein